MFWMSWAELRGLLEAMDTAIVRAMGGALARDARLN
jgi:hypothetical protein